MHIREVGRIEMKAKKITQVKALLTILRFLNGNKTPIIEVSRGEIYFENKKFESNFDSSSLPNG